MLLIEYILTYIEEILRKRPELGFASSVIVAATPYIKPIQDIIGWVGAIVGLLIGIITFFIQLKVLAEKYPNNRIIKFLGFTPKVNKEKKD